MKSKLVTLLLLFGWSISQGQLPDNAVGVPDIFNDVYQNDSILKMVFTENTFFKGGKTKKYWKVFSDKVNNTTFITPNGKNKSELDFMEKVTVAEIEKNWAHIYKEPHDQAWPAISAEAEDLGWIKMDNLLLSQYCLANKSKFTQKAMVLTNISILENGTKDYISKEFFYGADLKTSSKNFARTFEIYFVFKKTSNSVLLAKTDILEGSSEEVKGSVLGWMHKSNVTFWDYRICMEPNWSDIAQKEYMGVPISVFIKKDQANEYFQNGSADSAIRKRYLEGKRDTGTIWRSPVLGHEGNLKKIGTIGYMSAIEEKDLANLQSKLQDVNEKIENINVLFAIDGTKSMEQFYIHVSQGIAAWMSRLKAKDTQNRFKFGVVIFRDYSDEKTYEIQKLTSDYKEVIGFLNEVNCYGEKRNASALFNGLIEGINNAGFQKGQSNFIILVGDAGNRKPDPKGKTLSQVVELMSEYQCSMVGFQVNNGYGTTYEDFIDNIREMVLMTANELNKGKINTGNMIAWEMLNNNAYKLKLKITEKREQENLIVAGRIDFPSKGASLPVDFLRESVETTIDDYDNRVNMQKTILENTLNSPSGDFTAIFETWLRNQGFSNSEILRLKTVGAVRVEGWTADKINGRENYCYLPVAFLSLTEFYSLVETCKKLNFIQTSSNRRKSFQQSLIQECKTVIGDQSQATENSIEKMSLNDVWNMLFGIPFFDQELGKVKIKNITSRSIFSEAKLDKFIERFKDKLNRLQKIMNTSYPYSFIASNETYFWIPLSDLP